MLARSLLGLLVLELCGYAALVHAAVQGTVPAAVVLAAIGSMHVGLRCCAAPLGVLVCLMNEPRGARPRLPAGRALLVFGRECAALWRNYVLAPFARLFPTGPVRPDAGAPDVVLVHGILCNRVVWRPFLAQLRRAGRSARTVELEPVLGSLDDMALDLGRALHAPRSGRPIVLVAHSMGGLVARRLLQLERDPGIAALVTIGTPHQGSTLAYCVPGHAARAMRPGSEWLERLDRMDAQLADSASRATAGLPDAGARRRDGVVIRRLAIRTVHDELVSPAEAARWPAAREIVVDGVGHVALLADERVVAAVLHEIDAVAAGCSAPNVEPLPCCT